MKMKILTGVLAIGTLVSTSGFALAYDKVGELEKAIQTKQDDIKSKSTEIANLENVVEEHRVDLDAKQQVIEEHQDQIDKQKAEKEASDKKRAELKAEKEAIKAKADRLAEENNRLKGELQQAKHVKQAKRVTSTAKSASSPKKASEGASFNVQMTAYIAMCNSGCTGITATGIDVRNSIYYKGMRVIAVDPSVIPLHSIVKVTVNGQSFTAIAIDTGGAIKGHKADLLVASTGEALRFGRQTAKITRLN